MNQPEEIEAFDREYFARDTVAQVLAEQHARAIGSPLSMGSSSRQQAPPLFEGLGTNGGNGSNGTNGSNGSNGTHNSRPIPPPQPQPQGRALSSGTTTEKPSGFQRAIDVVRLALPLVQKILPLLDGNIGTAVSNFLTPPPHPQPKEPPPPPPKVDLAPLNEGLAELRTQHRQLRDQLTEQNGTLKRVEDQLEMVREATDRNTLEQQELLEDLKHFSNKVKIGAFIAIGLLTVGVVLNLVLYLHMQRVLP
jgi:hypothetical protein